MKAPTKARNGALRVRTTGSLPELSDLESAWAQLSESAPDAHLATLFPVVLANARWRRPEEPWQCYATFGSEGALRIGLFGRKTRLRIKGITTPAFDVGAEHVSSMALAPDADPQEVRHLIEAVIAGQSDRTVIEFGKVGGREFGLLHTAAKAAGILHTYTTAGAGYFFDTRAPFDELFGRFGPRLRRNLRRERRRLGRRHSIEFTMLESASVEQNLAQLELYMSLEASGWKGRNGSDMGSTEPGYYRCMVESGAREGMVRWYSLLADGRPVAMYLCFRHHATIWAPKTAYDEGFAAYSPGNELLLRMLEQLCADPQIHRLHMITAQPWVAAWHPEEEPYYRFRLYQPSLSGRLFCLAERTRDGFRRLPILRRGGPAVIPAGERSA